MPIFDQGYQHWNGPLSGHAWRWLAVARHGVRATFKNRFVRWFLFAAWVPALALVAALAVWGLLEQQSESVLAFLKPLLPAEMVGQPRDFRAAVWTIAYSFFFKAELAGALFLVLVVGPTLVSRDLRFNALPLYFSRPLRRVDYFLGKLGVIGFFLAATQVVPAAVAYLLGVAFSLDAGVVRDTWRLLWAGPLYGLVITLSAGTLMLALSSLSRRSIYVAIAWAGFVFLTLMLSGLLIGIHVNAEQRHVVDEGIRQWVHDHPPPPGVEMYGPYPRRFGPPAPPGQKPRAPDAGERWTREWSTAYSQLWRQAQANRMEDNRTDWRPVVSYATNLDRLGDWLLDTDAAWVFIGKAIERPRAAFGPMANLQAGGRLPRELTGPANDRLLADRLVWQFPWAWSAAVLGGLWVLSVVVLSSRVKSLDRLK
ncbi:MAG TPA: hypothetical protein VGF55_07810 [Gemmataceae bacterium]|jgi:hypothetical protein